MAHILIMEDDVEVAFHLDTILSALGHDVRWSRTAKDALEVLREESFDLIITDLYIRREGRIVDEGGIHLIGKVRSPSPERDLRTRKDIPIIAFTAPPVNRYNPYPLNTAKSVGADYGLYKPISEAELVKTVASALQAA